MNKQILIEIISVFIGCMSYDIVSTIKVRREIERNKKLRQQKYEERVKKINERHEKKLADNESALIQGLITLEEYEKNKKEIENDKD